MKVGPVSTRLFKVEELAVNNDRIISITDITTEAIMHYRLKFTNVAGDIEYSKVLMLHNTKLDKTMFKIFTAIIERNTATLSVYSDSDEPASFGLIYVTGRTIYQHTMMLKERSTPITVHDLSGLPKGTYVAILKAGKNLYKQMGIKN
jgi:hypothetical protein